MTCFFSAGTLPRMPRQTALVMMNNEHATQKHISHIMCILSLVLLLEGAVYIYYIYIRGVQFHVKTQNRRIEICCTACCIWCAREPRRKQKAGIVQKPDNIINLHVLATLDHSEQALLTWNQADQRRTPARWRVVDVSFGTKHSPGRHWEKWEDR